MTNENTIEMQPAAATSASQRANTIGSVWKNILQHPAQLIRRWNYKAAVLSSSMRSSIFLLTYLQIANKEGGNTRQSVLIAFGAASAQFAYRFFSAGIFGSLIQSFRRVEPAWQAMLMIMLLIPAISHFFEILVQVGYGYYTGTASHTDEAIIRSICVSIISTLFNLFAMRRGLLLVGSDEEDRQSFWGDIKDIPRTAAQFVSFVPSEICQMLFRKQFLAAFVSVIGFGVFAELMCWAMFSKPYWTYNKGHASWATYWGVGGIVLILLSVGAAAVFERRKLESAKV